ncbi:HAD family hydrolase [Metallosphaera tengchongensis]|uniref:HAD family hydrolase n=1 Tax=Metallosphaera tengchongensis TaxID=1532350 RepID=A0A6N0NT04_9CREN|nr:HAD family hydrolase [Metallosphaera tengchongensis]QKQ99236.1 HAD family hydrolase [Metallosphaera tengchongensis]
MQYAVWLDGVILDVYTSEALYSIYKGDSVPVPLSIEVHHDWPEFYSKLKGRGDLFILSPYPKEVTENVIAKIGLDESYVYNENKTKPSKEPMEILFRKFSLDPLKLILIGSSPLDLLSVRFFDSRIKVACVKRKEDCSRYSPFLQTKNLNEMYNSLKRLNYIL